MAKSSAKTVDEYIAEASEDRVDALNELRKRCQEILVGYREGVEFGMPSYSRNDQVEVAFANQSNYISLYILKTMIVERNRDLLPSKTGKSCIRYTSPAKMDIAVIDQLLRETVEDTGEICS
jgi:uncharacterized protein YdhG (YjbR/CyaY superfamily)